MSMKASTLPAHRPQSAIVRWGVYGCFFFSGATALIFEVLWSRQFVTVFGNSSYAISIVLCAYMAGLGLGGLHGGRVADRARQPAAVYGVIQAIVAAYALAIPPLMNRLRTIVPMLSILSTNSLLVSTLARFLFSFVILIIPCFMMGATLPLLVRAVTESDKFIGRRIGALYCLNTLGAALGCFAAGFWMVDTLGLRGMNFAAVGVNFAIAVVAFVLSKPVEAKVEETTAHKESQKLQEPLVPGWLLLTVGFINGLAGLACEVLWVRYMAFIGDSTYVFPTILCIYLLGMGLGGLIYGLLAGCIRPTALALGVVELLLGLSAPATFITAALIFSTGPPPPLGLVGMSLISVTIPTVLMGISFPLLCAVYGRHVQTLGQRVGLLFAINTAGTVLGSLLPIFVLVPMLGIQMSVTLVSLLYGVMGLLLLVRGQGLDFARLKQAAVPATVYIAAVIVFIFFVPSNLCQKVFLATSFNLDRHTDIAFYREGRTGTSIVAKDRVNKCKTVYINGVSEVPVLYSPQLCFKMIGDLGPMLANSPDDVLMICFGGGIAAGATSQLPEVKSLTIVDLESSVVKAAGVLKQENNGILENPKAHVVIDDGRNYIMTCGRKWPVIVSDSTHPKSGDSWVLYTQDFYGLVKEHLTDDGVFVEWVPMHELHTAEFKIIARTFQSVFPHASLWLTHGIDEQGAFSCYTLLAATPGPLKIDVNRLRDRLNAESVRRDLEPYGLHTPAGFLDTFICAEDALRQWAGDGPVNTDNLPYTQYETRYSKGPLLDAANFNEPMEDIYPYLTATGSEEQTKQLREELALRAKATRQALLGRLENAYTLLPNDIRFRKMHQLYEEGPYYIQQLIAVYQNDAESLENLAISRIWGPGGVQATIPIYEQVLKLDGKNVKALNIIGAKYIDAGQLETAQDYLKRAVELSPDCVTANYNLGLVLERMDRHEEALKHWERAAVISKDEKAADQWGMCLEQQGKLNEAIKWYEKAVERRPAYITARLHLVYVLHKVGRTQEALDHLRYVLKIDPENPTALTMQAKLNEWNKKRSEEKASQQPVSDKPSN